ncbi:MFS transporter [Phenylobacterium sp. SCN 70-31]|uniref:spinster family MFS transporter n=1 Tax=Phenylobacterium sp. SCN 70-31 TaxID=1660129 RepID=UPI0025F3A566|nr:MFS transporter [Phenylobacterium sp. SCN 70-31]
MTESVAADAAPVTMPETQRPAPTHDPGFLRQRRTALVLLFLAFTFSIMDRQIVSILAEPIKLEFGLSDTQLGFLGGLAFAAFYVTLGLPLAMMADRGGRKTIITFSLATFSAMTAICGLAQNFWHLLLARFGVGIGEAGVNPSSHSILADYYPPEKRSGVMSIIALGANVGMLLGLVLGGFVAHQYGWRAAFFVVGLPGVLLALAVHFFLKEAPRGFSEGRASAAVEPPPLRESVAYFWSNRAMRHLIAASMVAATISYGMGQWQPAFFMRSFGLTPAQVGVMLAGVFGVMGGLGAVTGGWLTDRLQQRRVPWGVWMIAVSQLVMIPFQIAAFLSSSPYVALALFALPAFLSGFYLGPSLALVQSLARLRMRSVAAAVKMLCVNLFGLGIGPMLIGVFSDMLRPSLGQESLRYSLIIFAGAHLWAAVHFYLCGRNLEAGLAEARRD